MAEEENIDEFEVITLDDENGVSHDFAIINELEIEGVTYYALLPYYETTEEVDQHYQEDNEVVIMRLSVDQGNEILETIDDQDEYQKVAAAFNDSLKDE